MTRDPHGLLGSDTFVESESASRLGIELTAMDAETEQAIKGLIRTAIR